MFDNFTFTKLTLQDQLLSDTSSNTTTRQQQIEESEKDLTQNNDINSYNNDNSDFQSQSDNNDDGNSKHFYLYTNYVT